MGRGRIWATAILCRRGAMRNLLMTLAGLALIASACGEGGATTSTATSLASPVAGASTTAASTTNVIDAHASGAAARSHLAPRYQSAPALVATLASGGVPCVEGTIESGDDDEFEAHGSCILERGGTIGWLLDLGDFEPQPAEPGELGSGEEAGWVHDLVCMDMGGGVVLGPNWRIAGDDPNALAPVAAALHGYLYQPDCATPPVPTCERVDFSGARATLTLSPESLEISPSEVPAGNVLLCMRVTEYARATVWRFDVANDVDVISLLAVQPVYGRALESMDGVGGGGGSAATVEAGDVLDLGTHELEPGRQLFLGELLPVGENEGNLPEDMIGPAAVLLVR